jgi:membrane protease subunit (stomatin/prohibitin family)
MENEHADDEASMTVRRIAIASVSLMDAIQDGIDMIRKRKMSQSQEVIMSQLLRGLYDWVRVMDYEKLLLDSGTIIH